MTQLSTFSCRVAQLDVLMKMQIAGDCRLLATRSRILYAHYLEPRQTRSYSTGGNFSFSHETTSSFPSPSVSLSEREIDTTSYDSIKSSIWKYSSYANASASSQLHTRLIWSTTFRNSVSHHRTTRQVSTDTIATYKWNKHMFDVRLTMPCDLTMKRATHGGRV